MTIRQIRVAASSDDLYIYWNGSAWTAAGLTSTSWGAGYVNATQNKEGGGGRWLNLNIPRYADIVTVTIKFTGSLLLNAVNCNTRFTGELSGIPATFSDLANYQSRRGTIVGGADDTHITTAQVDWDGLGEWVVDGEYTSPELKTIVQEIANATAIKDLAIFWDDHDGRSTTGAARVRVAISYNGSSTKAPLLYAEFIPPYKVFPSIDLQKLPLIMR